MKVGRFNLNRDKLIEAVVKNSVILAECDAWFRANMRDGVRGQVMREIQENGTYTDFIDAQDRCWVSFQAAALPREESIIDEALRRIHEKISPLDLIAWEALAWDDDYLTNLWNGSSTK